jgi:hypothetical protein
MQESLFRKSAFPVALSSTHQRENLLIRLQVNKDYEII